MVGCAEDQPAITPPVSPPSEETTAPPVLSFSPFITYAHWGFSISVPADWRFVETRDPETGGGIIDLFVSGTSFNSMSITASFIDKIGGVPAIASEAQLQIENARNLWGDIELQDNKAEKGNWDWFLSFDSILESTNQKFHTEIYFKATETHYYMLKLSFAEADRDTYPWKEVIDTFTIS